MASSFTLGDHFASFIKEMVATGRYASASEVVRDGLRLLEEREHLREAKLGELRRAIQDGFDSGPAVPLDMEDVRRKARALLADRTSVRARAPRSSGPAPKAT